MRLLSILLLSGLSASIGAHAQYLEHNERTVSISFSSLRANSGPGQCGCFYLAGGNAAFVQPLTASLSVVADLGGQTGSSLVGTANGLSLITYTAGPRLLLHHYARMTPFVEVLGGAAHAFNTYLPTAPATSSANSFAMLAGGGVDIHVSHRVAFQPARVDYLLTGLPNGSSGKQNNLRLGAGIIFHVR